MLIKLNVNQTYPRDWPDLSSKLLLNSVKSESVIVGDQVDGDTKVAESREIN